MFPPCFLRFTFPVQYLKYKRPPERRFFKSNVNHETSIFLYGCITICLVMQFRCSRGKWRRRENAVASKIHVSLCIDVIRFRTWFHRIQLSYLPRAKSLFQRFSKRNTNTFVSIDRTFGSPLTSSRNLNNSWTWRKYSNVNNASINATREQRDTRACTIYKMKLRLLDGI